MLQLIAHNQTTTKTTYKVIKLHKFTLQKEIPSIRFTSYDV
jgi:hypothetical protein